MSLTSVTNTGSKAHACTQAKLGISLEGRGMEIVLVKQTSYACYPSPTIKLELCLSLNVLL